MKRSLSDQENVGSPNKEPRKEDPSSSSSSISPSDDDVMFHYDEHGQNDILRKKPWDYNLRYFKHVKISALALVKMVMHAHSGGRVEVMGLMQGKVNGDTIIVIDSFVLPVEGTETRVNAADDANEYMVEYVTMAKQVCVCVSPFLYFLYFFLHSFFFLKKNILYIRCYVFGLSCGNPSLYFIFFIGSLSMHGLISWDDNVLSLD